MANREMLITWGTLLISIIILVLLPFQTIDMQHGRAGSTITVTPSTFPVFTASLMGGLSLAHLLSMYKKRKEQKKNNEQEEMDEIIAIKPVLMSVVVLLIYAFLMDKLGWLIDTILLCSLMGVYFRAKIWQIVVAGVVVPIVINYMFKLMYVNLPAGFLG